MDWKEQLQAFFDKEPQTLDVRLICIRDAGKWFLKHLRATILHSKPSIPEQIYYPSYLFLRREMSSLDFLQLISDLTKRGGFSEEELNQLFDDGENKLKKFIFNKWEIFCEYANVYFRGHTHGNSRWGLGDYQLPSWNFEGNFYPDLPEGYEPLVASQALYFPKPIDGEAWYLYGKALPNSISYLPMIEISIEDDRAFFRSIDIEEETSTIRCRCEGKLLSQSIVRLYTNHPQVEHKQAENEVVFQLQGQPTTISLAIIHENTWLDKRDINLSFPQYGLPKDVNIIARSNDLQKSNLQIASGNNGSDTGIDTSAGLNESHLEDQLISLSASKSQAQPPRINEQPNDRDKSKPSPAHASLDFYLFLEFIRDLLQALGFADVNVIEPKGADLGYDFQAIYPVYFSSGEAAQQLWIGQIKHSHPSRKTTLEAIRQLISSAQRLKVDKAVLVTTTSLTSFAQDYLVQVDPEVRSKLEIWDADKLLSLQTRFPKLERKYAELIATFSPNSSRPFTTRQQRLIEQLTKCQPGQRDCHKYEDICIEILTEVFVPPLKKPKIQPRTLSGLERRDALFPLRGANQGWEDIRQDFAANFLLCEFKNYTEPFSKDEVNQTRNYLRRTIGHIAIIFSRQGASESAMKMRNAVYAEEQKVLLFFEDRHLIELLKMKEANQNPLDLIQEAIDEFYILYE